MITFNCGNCGRKFRLPESRAGKKGRCPKCRNVIIVPETQIIADLLTPNPPADAEKPAEKSPYNLTFLDAPQETALTTEPAERYGESQAPSENQDMLLLGYRKAEPEAPPRRRTVWIIDIFLYPLNASGLTILGLAVALPFVLHALTKFLALFTMVFPPGLIFLVLLLIIRSILGIVLFCYIWWYLSECIRDSALGGLRAPETAGSTPGLWDLICVVFRVIACIAISILPAVIYLGYVRRFDRTLWILYGCGAFFFPIEWLAVTMFDSVTALNPILIIGSVFSALFRYIGLVLFYYIPILAAPLLIYLLPRNWLMDYIIEFVALYLGMVTAHLLGRFYFRYQEKLNWEV